MRNNNGTTGKVKNNAECKKTPAVKREKGISFVVPVYKTEAYLEKCLKSLIDQNYANKEIICVLDGESKKAEAIIDKLKIKHYTIEHGGVCRARNYGFGKSTKEIVSFFDSDCYLEPGALSRWMAVFNTRDDIDFVYAGYKFTDGGAIAGEEFDKHLLTVNNYIATMFPMKRSVFPGFDEKVESLQDWDVWLTIAENGGKGYFIDGFDFITEPPSKYSISGMGCTDEMWLKRLNAVKKKHGIPDRKVCFISMLHKQDALRVAENIDADFRIDPSFKPNDYDVLYAVGFYPHEADRMARAINPRNDHTQVVIHWTGADIIWMGGSVAFNAVVSIINLFNDANVIHACENAWSKGRLIELGVDKKLIKILQLPMRVEDVNPLPKKPKVLLSCDHEYRIYGDMLRKALPDIDFTESDEASINEHTAIVRLTGVNVVDDNLKKFLMNGRYVISNITGLYTNYFDVTQEKSRKKMIGEIREIVKNTSLNKKAMTAYGKFLNPDNFKREVGAFIGGKTKFRNSNV